MSEPRSDPTVLNSATPAGLRLFFDVLARKNELPRATVSAMRSSSLKVLDTDQDAEDADLRALDIEDLLRRFKIKHRGDFTDESLKTYESRFRKSLDMYLKFISDDPSWNKTKRRVRLSRKTAAATDGKSDAVHIQDSPTSAVETSVQNVEPGMMQFPIPIRPGVTGTLVLPEDLSKREAERVATVVNALAFEEQSGPSATSE